MINQTLRKMDASSLAWYQERLESYQRLIAGMDKDMDVYARAFAKYEDEVFMETLK